MDNLNIDATKCTPGIQADSESGTIEIRGKSYPENPLEFYQPLLDWVDKYLKSDRTAIIVIFEILYFNSSTSKVFYDLFDILKETRQMGKNVEIYWQYNSENSSAEEAGEELKADFQSMNISLVAKSS